MNLITRVKDRINRCGWIQKSFGHSAIGYCIVGAYREEWFIADNEEPFVSSVIEAIEEIDPDNFSLRWAKSQSTLGGFPVHDWRKDPAVIFHWNDTPGRTQAQVMEVLERAEKIWERDHAN